jgi:hypothetical protein
MELPDKPDLIDNTINLKMDKIIKNKEKKMAETVAEASSTNKIYKFYTKYISKYKYYILFLLCAGVYLYYRYYKTKKQKFIYKPIITKKAPIINMPYKFTGNKIQIAHKINTLTDKALTLKECGHSINYPCICANKNNIQNQPIQAENISNYLPSQSVIQSINPSLNGEPYQMYPNQYSQQNPIAPGTQPITQPTTYSTYAANQPYAVNQPYYIDQTNTRQEPVALPTQINNSDNKSSNNSSAYGSVPEQPKEWLGDLNGGAGMWPMENYSFGKFEAPFHE